MLLKIVILILEKIYAYLIPTADSIYYTCQIAKQRRELLFQSSENYRFIHARDWALYLYCIWIIVRYLLSSYCLHAGLAEAYFRLDIVMEVVHRKSHFDKLAFALVSFMLAF